MPEIETKEIIVDPLLAKLKTEREVGLDYQKRRHIQWDENYTLYRDTVSINRLTQRQAVNIPLMKETVKTLLAEMDEAPDIFFKNLDNDIEKEYVLNELWTYEAHRISFDGLDIQDKKNVLLFGRSFIKMNFFDEEFSAEVLDNMDILVDPKVDPLKIDDSRFLVHQNIFRPLADIMENDKYDQKGKDKLKVLMTSGEGLILDQANREALEIRAEKMKTMGADNYEKSIEELISGSNIMVALTEHYTNLWNKQKGIFEKYVIVVAQNEVVLYKQPLKKVLGVDFWPFVSWASDLDVSDVWTDAEADIVRVINKVINAWVSQGAENRTLKNWGMKYYDSTKGFNPQSFTPEPFGWYPIPGNPNDIIKDVVIGDMGDSIPEMRFLIEIIEKATATPSGQKGMVEKKQITLGEVQMVVGKAVERVKGIAKFYRKARQEFAEKWYAIMEANVAQTKSVKLYKTSYKGNVFEKTVKPKDWKAKAGYKIRVTSSSEQEEEKTMGIQKLIAIKQQFPENPVLAKILEKKLLEIADLTPEEIKEVIAFEEQRMRTAQVMPEQMPQTPPPAPGAMPEMAPLTGRINRIKQLVSQ